MGDSQRWKIRENATILVLVEGTHDQDFIEKLLEIHEIGLTEIQLMPKGGKTQLGDNLKVLVKDPNFKSIRTLAILRDADSVIPSLEGELEYSVAQPAISAATRALESIRGHLKNANLGAPSAHGEYTNGHPRVGCFIFPDGKSDGMLETLCRQSLFDHPDSKCIDQMLTCIETLRGPATFSPKAWTHAFIAVQEDPDVHLVKAAKKGYLPLQHQAFSPLVQFLRNAVEISPE